MGTFFALLAAVDPLLPVGDGGGPPLTGLGFGAILNRRFFAISYQPVEEISHLQEVGEVLLGELLQDVFGDQGCVLCNLAG